MAEPRVVVCFPAYRDVPSEAVLSLVRVVADGVSSGRVVGFRMATDTYLSCARNQLLKEALALNPTHLLWMDSDMVVPSDVVSRLLKHKKDIVSGLYFARRPPHLAVCRRLEEWVPDSGEPFLCSDPPKELSEMAFVGFGCVLISAEVFRRCEQTAGRPLTFFSHVNDPEGEDVYFCRLVRGLGEKIFLDPSCKCGHITTSVL